MIAMADLLEVYEEVYSGPATTLGLFAELVRTGRAWELKEPYPQTARRLVDTGYVTPGGEVTHRGRASVLDEGQEGSPCDVQRRVGVRAFDEPIPGPIALPNV